MDLKQTDWFSDEMAKRTKRRYRSDRIFRSLGLASIMAALIAVVFIFGNIMVAGVQGFRQTQMELVVYLDPAKFGDLTAGELADPNLDREPFLKSDYRGLVRESLMAKFPDVSGRSDIRNLNKLVSSGARNQLRDMVMADPTIIGSSVQMWVPAAADVDTYAKMGIDKDVPEADRRLNDKQVSWIETLDADGQLRTVLSRDFLTSGDSREPELAGIWGAVVGSAIVAMMGERKPVSEVLDFVKTLSDGAHSA